MNKITKAIIISLAVMIVVGGSIVGVKYYKLDVEKRILTLKVEEQKLQYENLEKRQKTLEEELNWHLFSMIIFPRQIKIAIWITLMNYFYF